MKIWDTKNILSRTYISNVEIHSRVPLFQKYWKDNSTSCYLFVNFIFSNIKKFWRYHKAEEKRWVRRRQYAFPFSRCFCFLTIVQYTWKLENGFAYMYDSVSFWVIDKSSRCCFGLTVFKILGLMWNLTLVPKKNQGRRIHRMVKLIKRIYNWIYLYLFFDR